MRQIRLCLKLRSRSTPHCPATIFSSFRGLSLYGISLVVLLETGSRILDLDDRHCCAKRMGISHEKPAATSDQSFPFFRINTRLKENEGPYILGLYFDLFGPGSTVSGIHRDVYPNVQATLRVLVLQHNQRRHPILS